MPIFSNVNNIAGQHSSRQRVLQGSHAQNHLDRGYENTNEHARRCLGRRCGIIEDGWGQSNIEPLPHSHVSHHPHCICNLLAGMHVLLHIGIPSVTWPIVSGPGRNGKALAAAAAATGGLVAGTGAAAGAPCNAGQPAMAASQANLWSSCRAALPTGVQCRLLRAVRHHERLCTPCMSARKQCYHYGFCLASISETTRSNTCGA